MAPCALWVRSCDWNNTAGFQTGNEKVLVCVVPRLETVHPGDRLQQQKGKWAKYAQNPHLNVVGENRDPGHLRAGEMGRKLFRTATPMRYLARQSR
jgi:hypothetical protein